MSKPPVKAPIKSTQKVKASAPARPAAKGSARPAAKPTAPRAKPAPKSRTTAKTAPAPKAATARPGAAKPAVKPPAPKPVSKTIESKPAAQSRPAKPAAKTTSSPAAAKTEARKLAPKASGQKSAPKSAPTPPPPTPAPTRVSNRFTDRFAPARHVARALTEMVDLPKVAHKPDPKLANAWKHKAGRDLTEAELLAMPDSEFMNEKQIEFFRVRLQQQKDALLSNAGQTTEHLREDTSIVPDPADRATIEEEHALELRTRDRERKLLKKIAQSLTRLENGDYGFCDETGEPIGLARLLARPTATLSLEAQQRRELKQKMFGD